MVLVDILPAVTAHKGHKGRALCFKALRRYFANGCHEQGSALVKARFQSCHKHGISLDDTAHFEVANLLAILENTTPTAFWMLYHVVSNPSTIVDLRQELTKILRTSQTSTGVVSRNLDVMAMRDNCPLLNSLFQETLRHHSCGVSTRVVLEDTILNDEYHLKKGSIIQIPSRVLHTDPNLWSPTAEDFDPHRFLEHSGKDTTELKSRQIAFRAFGGGAHLCPGRHFARTEVMCLVAMFVMRYEIEPVSRQWEMPIPKASNIAAAVMVPEHDVEVEIRLRKGHEDGLWGFGSDDLSA